MKSMNTVTVCENHFKSDKPSKEAFVLKWIEMINSIEKNIVIKMTN